MIAGPPDNTPKDKVIEKIQHYSGGEITDHWLGGWARERQRGTTVLLFGLRNDRDKHGWGLDFETTLDDLQIVEKGVDGSPSHYGVGRNSQRIPSTDWSLRRFIAAMFLFKGTRPVFSRFAACRARTTIADCVLIMLVRCSTRNHVRVRACVRVLAWGTLRACVHTRVTLFSLRAV